MDNLSKIKVTRVVSPDIKLCVIDDRKFVNPAATMIRIETKEDGVIKIYTAAGFETDGRSGGAIVDLLIPNVGNALYRRAWYVHDALFAHAADCLSHRKEPALSFDTCNDLFFQIGCLPKRQGGGGFATWRMALAKRGVSTKFGELAFDRIDGFDRKNFGKVIVEVGAC